MLDNLKLYIKLQKHDEIAEKIDLIILPNIIIIILDV